MLRLAGLAVSVLYVGYAGYLCWQLRIGSEMEAEIVATRSWVRCTPPWHLFAGVLVPALRCLADLVCAVSGLLWPVEMFTRPWRSGEAG